MRGASLELAAKRLRPETVSVSCLNVSWYYAVLSCGNPGVLKNGQTALISMTRRKRKIVQFRSGPEVVFLAPNLCSLRQSSILVLV